MDVPLEVLVKVISVSGGLGVPLERHLRSLYIHKVNDALTAAAKFLDYCRMISAYEINILIW